MSREIHVLHDSVGFTGDDMFLHVPFPRNNMGYSQCHFQGLGSIFQGFLRFYLVRDIHTKELDLIIAQCLANQKIIVSVGFLEIMRELDVFLRLPQIVNQSEDVCVVKQTVTVTGGCILCDQFVCLIVTRYKVDINYFPVASGRIFQSCSISAYCSPSCSVKT